MPEVTQGESVAAAGRGLVSRLQWPVAALLGGVSDYLEGRRLLVLAGLMLLYFAGVCDACRHTPMWHDELFTFYIAQAPTLRAMWQDLRIYDLNPPLMYLLTRWSFALFGVSAAAARVPEMLGFAVWMACLFRFVERRMGVLFAAFAVLLLLESDLLQLAVDARPYTLMLGFLALALEGYQEATGRAGRRRGLGLAVLFVAVLGMLFSYVFGVFGVGALVAAEVWRSVSRRRVDGGVLAVLLAPALAVLTYGPLFENHRSAMYPVAFQPDGEAVFGFYVAAVSRVMVALSLTGLAVLLVLGPSRLRGGRRWFFSGPEWVALIFLMGSPLALMGWLMVSHGAFFNRYGAVGTSAFLVLGTALLGRWTLEGERLDGRTALLGCVVVLGMSEIWAAVPREIGEGTLVPTFSNMEPHAQACDACRRTAALDASLPLVDASGLAFLEMNHNETPTTLARVYYLTDSQASAQYAHADIFEQMPRLVAAFHLSGHTAEYRAFVRGNPRFFVLGRYDYPEDWLLRKLQADGAELQVLGRVSDSYRDTELYEVRVGTAQ